MTLTHLNFPETPLGDGRDVALARAVEAGCYAQHLLDEGESRPGLAEVVEAGRRAQDTLFFAGARIALRKLAGFTCTEVPREELFQEACLAIAEAIRYFDYRRGTRFTTYVYECISRALHSAAGRLRPGVSESRADRKAAGLLAETHYQAAARGERLGLRAAARAAGLSEASAARACIVQVSFDELGDDEPAAAFGFDVAEPTDFVSLLPAPDAGVLRARYGLDGPPQSRAQIAQALAVSVSTVGRIEVRALAKARQVLQRDLTRLMV